MTLLDYRNSQCPFFLPYFVFLFLPHPSNSKFVFTYWGNVLKASFYWRAPYLRSLDASCICNVVEACICKKAQAWKPQWLGLVQKVCNISKWIGRGRIAKVKKEKWIGTARLAQAKLRRKEKMLLLLFLSVLRNQILWRAGSVETSKRKSFLPDFGCFTPCAPRMVPVIILHIKSLPIAKLGDKPH